MTNAHFYQKNDTAKHNLKITWPGSLSIGFLWLQLEFFKKTQIRGNTALPLQVENVILGLTNVSPNICQVS